MNTCPKCNENELHEREAMNAVSRRNGEYICSQCGMDEAMEDYINSRLGKEELDEEPTG